VSEEDARWALAARSIRLSYFWVFAAVGTFGPFAALYYRELGFSGLEVGVLVALPAVAVAISGPLWGAAADALSAHRLLLRVTVGLGALLALIVTQVTSFPAVFALIALSALALAPAAPFLDGYALAADERGAVSYGGLRVWGSVGYTLAVLAVGRLMGAEVDRRFLVAHAVFLAVALAATWWLPAMGARERRPLLAGLQALARNRAVVALLAVSYLAGAGAGAVYGFLAIRMEELGASTGLIGLAIALGAFSEMPVVAFGSAFLRWLGATRLIALAIAVYTVRLAAYGVLTAPAWFLPVQLLHSLSYGAFLIASVTLVHRLAGREHAATGQALLAAVSFGLGNLTGSIAGGALLDAAGSDWLFRAGALLMIATLAVFLALDRLIGIGAAPDVSPLSRMVEGRERG
jgi:PPP family 3-phenylpropionic acid transporter